MDACVRDWGGGYHQGSLMCGHRTVWRGPMRSRRRDWLWLRIVGRTARQQARADAVAELRLRDDLAAGIGRARPGPQPSRRVA